MNIEKKHKLYEESVQNPENDVEFITEKFKELKNRRPLSIREDFGGTGYLCCEWVKQGEGHTAHVVDLDPEPMNYGKKRHWSQLDENQQDRVKYHELNVLDAQDLKTDVVCAFNFSYFIFKKRKELLDYFTKVREAMDEDGVFFLDMFGGEECYGPLEEETEHDGFTYFWDLDYFNPINNHVIYYIHFQEDGKEKHEKVFTYDWRMWSIPEIREILEDAGFKHTVVYWEGDDDDGGGNGEFEVCEETEQCDSWVVYIAAYN